MAADLDGDGDGEVLVTFPQDHKLYCLRGARRLLWRRQLPGTVGNLSIADADGDGAQDVWAWSDSRLYCLSGRDGAPVWKGPAFAGSNTAIANLAGDGTPCAVFGLHNVTSDLIAERCSVAAGTGWAELWRVSVPKTAGELC